MTLKAFEAGDWSSGAGQEIRMDCPELLEEIMIQGVLFLHAPLPDSNKDA
eukprot:CAMPEP_0117037134 /NCGR_PEP_ID=MMETSP0472-20121206/26252_1 /TAXON_ID=693140 ORGANISM="Tiarina fusus, Strain LIS" /NCGR_SAMPLE_ID=MMETSP0472 /ASSEMBLY_ACC=CAM_ASM_000603 /LENGTH=49 /DNA_ID=CAMNT_0004747075 /DNA_START=506 /DNA_END=655 /DNA_ORIENTATION=+